MLSASVALALMPALGFPETARAQTAIIPDTVRALDAAATKLFVAAEAGKWVDAAPALRRVQSIAPSVSDLESAYVDAGGALEDFIAVVNNLSADAIEASTALAVKDRRWLVSCADRIASRAGELSRPFDRRVNAVVPRIDTLLFLARRMRRAIVWGDKGTLTHAHDGFTRLWASLRDELAGNQPTAVNAVQRALANVGRAPSPGEVKRLYEATQALGAAVA
jgi:hypothetical protein